MVFTVSERSLRSNLKNQECEDLERCVVYASLVRDYKRFSVKNIACSEVKLQRTFYCGTGVISLLTSIILYSIQFSSY